MPRPEIQKSKLQVRSSKPRCTMQHYLLFMSWEIAAVLEEQKSFVGECERLDDRIWAAEKRWAASLALERLEGKMKERAGIEAR